jgi:hypothetical protein
MSTENFPTSRRKRKVPDGWYFERIIVEPKLMGGVSNGSFYLACWTRIAMNDSVSKLKQVPSQDLRSVMKTAVFGRDAQALVPSLEVGEEA